MPRPRFEKLDPERRQAILQVAVEEFAAHGFEAASYNRIIERLGLSKGALYYYFDDKEDLYATVLKDAVQRLVIDVGDLSSARDIESFWSAFEDWYRRSLHAFQKEPQAIGLARTLVKALARGNAAGALVSLRRFVETCMKELVARGQELNAIRRDLPDDLLTAVLLSLEEGIDLWLADRIGGMTPREIDAAAVMLTRLYRRIAAPEPAAQRSPKKRARHAPKPR